jgi:hypothetical protein
MLASNDQKKEQRKKTVKTHAVARTVTGRQIQLPYASCLVHIHNLTSVCSRSIGKTYLSFLIVQPKVHSTCQL